MKTKERCENHKYLPEHGWNYNIQYCQHCGKVYVPFETVKQPFLKTLGWTKGK